MPNYTFVTIGEVIDKALSEALGSTRTTVTAIQTLSLIDEVQNADSEFLTASSTRGCIEKWSFQEVNNGFSVISTTTLDGAVAVGGVSIMVDDSSSFPATGMFALVTANNAVEFVTYTANVANTFTVEAVKFAHSDGAVVYPMYELPANYGKMVELKLNSVPLDVYEGTGFPDSSMYAVVDGFIVLPKSTNTGDVWYRYSRGLTYLTNTAVNITANRAVETSVPKEFRRYAVEKIKAYIYGVRHRFDLMQYCQQLADRELRRALAFEATLQTSNTITV